MALGQYTLIILLFGYSGAPSIDASMQFNHQATCEESKAAVTASLKGKGYSAAFVDCVPTRGRK